MPFDLGHVNSVATPVTLRYSYVVCIHKLHKKLNIIIIICNLVKLGKGQKNFVVNRISL